MKKNIHPDYHPVIFVDVGTGKRFFTYSTIKTKTTETVDGVEYFVKTFDITSDSHPVYTGKSRFIGGSESRVEKFRRKLRFSKETA